MVRSFGEEMFIGFVEGQIGKVREVIVEERRSGEINGLTDNFIRVALSGGDPSPGALVDARLERGITSGRVRATAIGQK